MRIENLEAFILDKKNYREKISYYTMSEFIAFVYNKELKKHCFNGKEFSATKEDRLALRREIEKTLPLDYFNRERGLNYLKYKCDSKQYKKVFYTWEAEKETQETEEIMQAVLIDNTVQIMPRRDYLSKFYELQKEHGAEINLFFRYLKIILRED